MLDFEDTYFKEDYKNFDGFFNLSNHFNDIFHSKIHFLSAKFIDESLIKK